MWPHSRVELARFLVGLAHELAAPLLQRGFVKIAPAATFGDPRAVLRRAAASRRCAGRYVREVDAADLQRAAERARVDGQARRADDALIVRDRRAEAHGGEAREALRGEEACAVIDHAHARVIAHRADQLRPIRREIGALQRRIGASDARASGRASAARVPWDVSFRDARIAAHPVRA